MCQLNELISFESQRFNLIPTPDPEAVGKDQDLSTKTMRERSSSRRKSDSRRRCTVADGVIPVITRKPCYRKDERAMRPRPMGALKIFGSFQTTPTATLLPKFLMGFCPIDAMNVRIKFEVRSFTRS